MILPRPVLRVPTETTLSEQNDAVSIPPGNPPATDNPGFRPAVVAPVPLEAIAASLGIALPPDTGGTSVTGVSLNSRTVEPGDLYLALPGATRHGADFVAQAVAAGAVAVLSDEEGARQLALDDLAVPVLIVGNPRAAVGTLAASYTAASRSTGVRPHFSE